MNKIIILAFTIALQVLAWDVYQFVLFSLAGHFFWQWYAILLCKVVFLFLVATRIDRLVHVVKSILWAAAYRSFRERR